MFGRGVGTKGAGGPGILQTLGSVAIDTSWLPSVTGVLGGFTPILIPTTSHPRTWLADEEAPRRAGPLPNRPIAGSAALAHIHAGPMRSPARRTKGQKPLRRRPSNR